jgi:hypothetical protein
VRERLSALALEALPRAEAARASFHLARCPACRAEASRERDLVAFLPRALEPCEPPREVLERVLHRLRVSRRRNGSRRAALGVGTAAVTALVAVLLFAPKRAVPLEEALESPDVAVINLFAALDSPLTSHYEFRTESELRFDRSVGRILFNVSNGDWRLVVHGLPRPPRGTHYLLSAQLAGEEVPLGIVGRWEDGVATLAGSSALELTRTERLSVQLVGRSTRIRLLEATAGAW